MNIKNGKCRIQDAKLGLMVQVNMTVNRMFLFDFNYIEQSCLTDQLNESAWLWHFDIAPLKF